MRRWGDNDVHFGPFTFARDRRWRPLGIILSSTDDEGCGCSLRISGFGGTVIVALPSWVLQPERKIVFPGWDAATVERLGRDWYEQITQREFGFSLHEGLLSVMYGRCTLDSSTEQRWSYFLPWTQWRFVRHSLYRLDGTLFSDLPHPARHGTPEYNAARAFEESCPTVTFDFADFDGTCLTATTKIEEREWLFGTGWFRWLSWFRRPKISRSLDIKFSGETGRRKGSWKGGTIGCGIEMKEGELHKSAFMRYCEENEMTFLGVS